MVRKTHRTQKRHHSHSSGRGDSMAMNGRVPGLSPRDGTQMTVNGPGSGKFSATEGVVAHPLKDKRLYY